MSRKVLPLRIPGAKYFTTAVEQWQVVMLAKMGGFTYRAIAAAVLHRRPASVTDEERAAVGYLLRREGVSLRTWREMQSPIAKKYAHARMRPRRKKQYAA